MHGKRANLSMTMEQSKRKGVLLRGALKSIVAAVLAGGFTYIIGLGWSSGVVPILIGAIYPACSRSVKDWRDRRRMNSGSGQGTAV